MYDVGDWAPKGKTADPISDAMHMQICRYLYTPADGMASSRRPETDPFIITISSETYVTISNAYPTGLKRSVYVVSVEIVLRRAELKPCLGNEASGGVSGPC